MGKVSDHLGQVFRTVSVLAIVVFVGFMWSENPRNRSIAGSVLSLRHRAFGSALSESHATRMCIMMPTLSLTDVSWTPENVDDHMALRVSLQSLMKTVTDDMQYIVLLAYNHDDAVLGREDLRQAFMQSVRRLVGSRKNVHVLFRPIYSGRCGTTLLWNIISDWGYDIGCDYFVPGNDDVVWITPGWAKIAVDWLRNQTHPCRNFGIASFTDKNNIRAPTFHVISRLHMYIHDRVYYPVGMTGWGVDPWIYESYKRVGAAKQLDMFLYNHVTDYDPATGEVKGKLFDRAPEPRYDINAKAWKEQMAPSVDAEERFLQEWMDTPGGPKCCDTMDCSPPQLGTSVALPVVAEFGATERRG